MSKFSKILAVLMSVCLLFGAITALLASADGETEVVDNGVTDVKTYKTTYAKNTNPTPFTSANSYNANVSFGLFDYLTLDMDVTLPDGSTGYPASFKFNHNIANSASKTGSGLGYVYILKADDGFYYLGLDSKTPNVTEVARLSATPGVHDHITAVYKVNRTDGAVSSIDALWYVNGKYVCTKAITHAELNDNTCFTRISVQGTWSTNNKVTITMNTRTYKTGDFSGTNALAEIAEDTTKKLYDSTSDAILYNAYYAIPGKDFILVVDGKKTYIPDAASSLLAGIKNGSVIESKIDITNFDVPEEVDGFTLKYDEDSTVFTLTEEDSEKYFFLRNGDGSYTVRVATEDDKINLKRIVKYGDKKIVASIEEYVFLLAPKSNFTFSSFDLNELKLYQGVCNEWIIDVDGDVPEKVNLYGEEAARPLNMLEVELIREEFAGILAAYATAEEGSITVTDFSDCKYIAGYENNGVFTPILDSNGGYDNYKDIDTLATEQEYWKGLDVNVVYYLIQDVDGEKVAVPGEASVAAANALWNASEIQLNGVENTTETKTVTDLVKNTFKENGTVDGYGVLTIG